jgi:uncharacterized protein
MAEHGMITWSELNTRDPQAAMRFYAATLGWSFTEKLMPSGPYYLIQNGDQPVMAGIFNISGPEFDGMPEHWFTYIAVDDVDMRVEKALAAGASLVRPVIDVPCVARIAIVREPGGAVVAWMTSREG